MINKIRNYRDIKLKRKKRKNPNYYYYFNFINNTYYIRLYPRFNI